MLPLSISKGKPLRQSQCRCQILELTRCFADSAGAPVLFPFAALATGPSEVYLTYRHGRFVSGRAVEYKTGYPILSQSDWPPSLLQMRCRPVADASGALGDREVERQRGNVEAVAALAIRRS